MDKYLVSLAFLLLCAEAGWLYYDMSNPAAQAYEGSVSDKPLGKILKSRSQVRKKAQDSLIWEETKKEQNLFAYDSVLTMNQSTAEIILQGESKISMNENTLVVIEPPRDGHVDGPLRLRFKKGNMSARSGRSPQSVETEEYIVEASRDTKMNIRSTEDDKIQIDAIEGEVKLLNPTDFKVAQVVNAGETAQIIEEQIKIQKTAQIDWNIPVDGQKFYTHQENKIVEFNWSGSVSGIEILNAENQQGAKLIDVPSAQSQYEVPLGLGNYMVKLLSNGQSSFARQVSIWPAPKIFLINPVIRQRFKKNAPIQFLWTQTKDVEQYIFELSIDPEFKKTIRQIKTSQMGVEITVSAVGEFYWRVRGIDSSGFEIPELYYNNFYILDKPLEAPKLKSPQIIRDDASAQQPQALSTRILKFLFNLLISTAHAEEKNYSAEFQWESVEGAHGYTIEISSTSDFRNLIVSTNVKKENFRWKNFKLGQYYWRVAAKDITGEQGLFSETAYADLNQIPQGPIKPVAPPKIESKPIAKKENEVKKVAEPNYDFEPWNFKFELGAHGVYSYQRGEDFNAKMFGLSPFDARITIMPPEHNFKFWVVELDLTLLNAKGSPEAQFPFQNKISSLAAKAHFIKNKSWGIVVGQYSIFRRADLEALGFNNALAGGVFKQWNIDSRVFRLGVLAGQIFSLETIARQSWSLSSQFDFTGEIKLHGGYSLQKDLFFDFTSQFYFGWSF